MALSLAEEVVRYCNLFWKHNILSWNPSHRFAFLAAKVGSGGGREHIYIYIFQMCIHVWVRVAVYGMSKPCPNRIASCLLYFFYLVLAFPFGPSMAIVTCTAGPNGKTRRRGDELHVRAFGLLGRMVYCRRRSPIGIGDHPHHLDHRDCRRPQSGFSIAHH